MRPIRPVRVVRPVGAPLVRGLVVGGAVYAAGRSAARSQAGEQDQNAAIAELQAQRAAGHQQQPTATESDVVGRLAQLGAMAQQGLLTAEEFATAKARLLGAERALQPNSTPYQGS